LVRTDKKATTVAASNVALHIKLTSMREQALSRAAMGKNLISNRTQRPML